MITYRRSDHLEVIGYSNSDFVGCVYARKFILGSVFLLVGGAMLRKSAKQYVVANVLPLYYLLLWMRNLIGKCTESCK